MPKLNKSEALNLGTRINRVLRPFLQVTEILAVAIAAEASRDALAQESEALAGIVKRLTKMVARLGGDQTVAEAALQDTKAATAAEQETLDVAKKTTADGLDLLIAEERKARLAFKKVLAALQGETDAAEARLADLHTEEERVNAKIKQFEALATPQE